MPTQSPYRLNTGTIDKDRKIIEAIETLPDYAPSNPEHSLAAVQQLQAELVAAQANEQRIQRELVAAREQVSQAAWALHERVADVKVYVEYQYGRDSVALHAVGLKRRSERKRPARREPRAE